MNPPTPNAKFPVVTANSAWGMTLLFPSGRLRRKILPPPLKLRGVLAAFI